MTARPDGRKKNDQTEGDEPMRRIIVFGGSFNPPIPAHERLLKAAMEGEGLSRIIEVEFPSVGAMRLGLVWVEKNCAVTEE